MSGRELKLNLFIYPGGHHEAAWRYPGSVPDRWVTEDRRGTCDE